MRVREMAVYYRNVLAGSAWAAKICTEKGDNKMNELKCNGSGYYDEPAYKAMKAASKTNLANIGRGDIVEAQMVKGNIREIVVVKCFDEIIAGLLLGDKEPKENCISIKSRRMMYADAGRMTYLQYDRVENYIRTVSESDVDYILSCIGQALDIQPLPQDQPIDPPKSEPASQTEKIANNKLSTELAITARERDIYERLYQDMLNRALGS